MTRQSAQVEQHPLYNLRGGGDHVILGDDIVVVGG
jgi:hypothetical protein